MAYPHENYDEYTALLDVYRPVGNDDREHLWRIWLDVEGLVNDVRRMRMRALVAEEDNRILRSIINEQNETLGKIGEIVNVSLEL